MSPGAVLLWVAGLGASLEPPRELDTRLVTFLEAPGPALSRVPKGFRIIALSHLADYCGELGLRPGLEEPARRCLASLSELALGPRVSPYGGAPPAALGDHGLYLSHLLIVLSRAAEVAERGAGRHEALARRVAEHLARRSSSAEPWHVIASYPAPYRRWPADQAATLYALHLADRAFGSALAPGPRDAYLTAMAAATTPLGLPRSEVTGKDPMGALPRGCALSFTVRYLAPLAPEHAAQVWQAYRRFYAVEVLGAAGFREWPPGFDGREDDDSGPIVFGIGAAATGLALAASRAVGDEDTYRALRRSEALVRGLGGEALQAAGDTILAQAIALWAEVQPAAVSPGP